MEVPTTIEEAHHLLKKLKSLSTTQSLLLKQHLLKKVNDASELVQKSLDSLSSDPRFAEFKVAFLALCLDGEKLGLHSPTGFPYGDELDQLRKAVDGTESENGVNGKLMEVTDDRIQLLESENGNLRELLQQIKLEMTTKMNDTARIDTVQMEVERATEEGEMKLAGLMKQMKDRETKCEAEKAHLHVENHALQQRLMASSHTNKAIQTDLSVVCKKLADTKDSYYSLTAATKKDLQDMKQELTTSMQGPLLGRCRTLEDTLKDVQEKYRKVSLERKTMHNIIQELKGNIRVYLRCRPLTPKEKEQFGQDAVCVSFPNEGEITVVNSEKSREKTWSFDEVFGLSSTQEQVYKDVSGLVVSVLDGYNVCIFAYGQTGSGKTYTMSGPEGDRGVNTRALDELFQRTQARKDSHVDHIAVSVLEVYNEEIRDLLVRAGTAGGGSLGGAGQGSDEKLEVRQGPEGVHVPGLTAITVNTVGDVIDLLRVADVQRSSRGTDMNVHSSRSHMMLTVTVTTTSRVKGGLTVRGKLNLVDLAGSERVGKSGATAGQALKETQNINSSLFALGDVMAARAKKQSHVPFRNSTLTYLLQDSLSQDSKTLMIVCISPVQYNASESFCSLDFAQKVATVELGKATKHVVGATAGVSHTSPHANSHSHAASHHSSSHHATSHPSPAKKSLGK